MDGYCLIKFRNQQENAKVCSFLVTTRSNFTVTDDLKQYMTEELKVKIIEIKDKSTNTITDVERIKMEEDDDVIIVEPTTIDNTVEQPPLPSSSPLDGYCVITFRNQQEKTEVINFLATTRSNYTVIDDLKQYLTSMFKGKIIERNNQSTNTIKERVKEETIDEVMIVDPPTIHNTSEQPLPASTNIASLSSTNTNQEKQTEKEIVVDDTEIVTADQVVPTVVHNTAEQSASQSSSNDVESAIVENKEKEADMEVMIDAVSSELVTNEEPPFEKNNEFQEVIDKDQPENEVPNENAPPIFDNNIDPFLFEQQSYVAPIIDPPQIDFNMDDIQPVDDDYVADQGDQHELFNNDDYEANIPYLERMFKEEEVEDEQNIEELETGGNTEETDQMMDFDESIVNSDVADGAVDNTLATISGNTPATSTPRRSKRAAKREISEDNISKRFTCKNCGFYGEPFSSRSEHVLSHAGINKYECLVNACLYKTTNRTNIGCHLKRKHMKPRNLFRQVQFTSEQLEQFEKMMQDCFPGTSEDNEYCCRICKESVGGCCLSMPQRRQHAYHHVPFMIYKCMEDGCRFESKTENSMQGHRIYHGKGATRKLTRIKLTEEQEEKIEAIVKKCFPYIHKQDNTDDETSGSETAPDTKKQKKMELKSDRSYDVCRKCGAMLQGYVKKNEHVMHCANISRYECIVAECGYKTASKTHIGEHMKRTHGKQPDNYREIQLTREQSNELDKMIKECFGNENDNIEDKCQICHQTVDAGHNSSSWFKRDHALHHVDFMMFKCKENGCNFEGKTETSVRLHRRSHKNRKGSTWARIELTEEQEEEIEKVFKKCFPNFDTRRDQEDEEEEDSESS